MIEAVKNIFREEDNMVALDAPVRAAKTKTTVGTRSDAAWLGEAVPAVDTKLERRGPLGFSVLVLMRNRRFGEQFHRRVRS